jgi:hypothetical protein
MSDQLTSITTLRPAIPASGLIANDTNNHFQGSTGEVPGERHRDGERAERCVARGCANGEPELLQYPGETGTGQRWGVWEEYRYDALRRRVLTRTQRPNTICNVANCYSSITRFIWDGDQLALELRAPGAPAVTMPWVPPGSGSSVWCAREDPGCDRQRDGIEGRCLSQDVDLLDGTAVPRTIEPDTKVYAGGLRESRAGQSVPVRRRSSRSAIQTLTRDWRGTPRRAASRSSDSTIHAGKSTFTRRCSRPG